MAITRKRTQHKRRNKKKRALVFLGIVAGLFIAEHMLGEFVAIATTVAVGAVHGSDVAEKILG